MFGAVARVAEAVCVGCDERRPSKPAVDRVVFDSIVDRDVATTEFCEGFGSVMPSGIARPEVETVRVAGTRPALNDATSLSRSGGTRGGCELRFPGENRSPVDPGDRCSTVAVLVAG